MASTFSKKSARAELGSPSKKKAKRGPARVIAPTGDYVARPDRDWSAYNKELRDRPAKTIDLIIDRAALASWRVRTGHRGQPAYCIEALVISYMLRAQFHLSLRATEGLMRRILLSAGLYPDLAPTFSTLSARRRDVTLLRPRVMSTIALADGTGYSFKTNGPWVQHKWRNDVMADQRYVRVTLCSDGASGAFVAAVVTPEYGVGSGEVSQFRELVTTCASLGATTLIGDGAYDNLTCYTAAQDNGVRLITPPQHNAVYGLHPDRDMTLAQIKRHGEKEWKKRVHYHQRSRVEADLGAPKQVFGDSTRARSFEGARADVLAKLSVHNLFRMDYQDLELALAA